MGSKTQNRNAAKRAVQWMALGLFCLPASLLRAEVDFVKQVRPIFAEHCSKCHGAEKQKGGLRLDARENVFKGGDSGEAAVVPGKSAESRLFRLITSNDEDMVMPPKGDKLKAEQIEIIRKWIDGGAKWPDEASVALNSVHSRSELQITDTDRQHWAFKPLATHVKVPVVRNSSWVQSPIDQFILEAQEKKGVMPSGPASRRTLIRRVYYDLLGLPPSAEEIRAFEQDASQGAYERLVDRLLESPHYGERWGRHWLDLARYADSDGYEGDADRPHAWPYRDWVIRAFNADMPFNQFVRWQIAGDEYAPADADAITATGFLTAGPFQTTTPSDTEENKQKLRYDELDDIVATTGQAMLGLTIGCARCHDHKYDPIPTRDYYRMVSAFGTSHRGNLPISKPHREREQWIAKRHIEYREAKMAELGLNDEEKFWLRQPEHFFVPIQKELYKTYGDKLKATDNQVRDWLAEAQRKVWAALDEAVRKAEADGFSAATKALIRTDQAAEPEAIHLLGRGSVLSKTEQVSFGFLRVLSRGKDPEAYWKTVRPIASSPMKEQAAVDKDGFVIPHSTYQRKALAEWLTDVDLGAGNLLARVIANRLWQFHFGNGLVGTPNDFGFQGDAPTHPELLDWLASELVRSGWSLKPMHRLIMSSAVYKQASLPEAGQSAQHNREIDPENRLFWHRRPVRMEAEVLRDAMLAVSGKLNRKMFGPSFRPIIPKEAMATRSKDPYPADIKESPELWRRTVYAFVKRSVRFPMAEVFDAPDPTAACGRRNTTTVATQALTLLNDPLVRECARQLASRVSAEAGSDRSAQAKLAYLLALGRQPTDLELARLSDFVQLNEKAKSPEDPTLTDLCHVLFTLNEFVYIN